jgi:hypothetical protein
VGSGNKGEQRGEADGGKEGQMDRGSKEKKMGKAEARETEAACQEPVCEGNEFTSSGSIAKKSGKTWRLLAKGCTHRLGPH